jgi:hypothetical protein
LYFFVLLCEWDPSLPFFYTRFFSFWWSILKLGQKWRSLCWLSLSIRPQFWGNKIVTRCELDALVHSCFWKEKNVRRI